MTTDAEILEALAEAELTDEPSSVQKGGIVERGDTPMMLSTMESAGWVFIYDLRDGRQVTVNRNMLPEILKKKDNDPQSEWYGKIIYTARDPGFRPKRGTLLCLLNPKHEDYDKLADLGLPQCSRDGLPNLYQVNSHMRHKHRDEWAVLEARREQADKNEDRAFQRYVMEKAVENAG